MRKVLKAVFVQSIVFSIAKAQAATSEGNEYGHYAKEPLQVDAVSLVSIGIAPGIDGERSRHSHDIPDCSGNSQRFLAGDFGNDMGTVHLRLRGTTSRKFTSIIMGKNNRGFISVF